MTPERWKRIEEVFNEVCDAEPHLRRGILDAACAGDADLRAEVESLLENDLGTSGGIRNIVQEESRLADSAVNIEPGSLFDKRFIIERQVGSGGMGTVYRALDRVTNATIALKVLHETSTGGESAERFLREARLQASLVHPGIVGYIAHGLTSNGRLYLAMPWLEGEDLAQRLARKPLSLRETITLGMRVANTLAFVHENGVIHRDIKPTNLFLPAGDVSRVTLLDFGIARRLQNTRAVTRTGMIIGTPEYMAPEQARGTRHHTAAIDMFSLGCVLYECIAGEAPFVAPHISAVLVRILFEEPVPLLRRRPGLAPEVAQIVERLLRKDPAARWSNASDLAKHLASFADLHEPPWPTSAKTPLQSMTPRNIDSEQILLSLVLALAPRNMATAETLLELGHDPEAHQDLLRTLQNMNVQADFLLGGALVVTIPPMESAKDQAAMAAKCALVIKDVWLDAPVVIVTGRGVRGPGGLTGDVLDRAWKMLSERAEPAQNSKTGPIEIDEVSASLLDGRFDVTPLRNQSGIFALGELRIDPDTGRLVLGKPTPCVGRESELSILDGIYEQVTEEDVARAALVIAPPGLGKSRLRQEFIRRLELRGEKAIVLIGRADPLKMQSACALLGDALRQRMELHAGLDIEELRERLRTRIASALPPEDALRVSVFLGEICGIPFPDSASPMLRAARQDPRAMYDYVETAWLDSLRLLQRDEPLILVLEDLHWSDTLTVKLIGATLRRTKDHALFVLALARPEVHDVHPNLWGGAHTVLHLHPLGRKASERLVKQVLENRIDAARRQWIIDQAAGHPLFLEELMRAAVDGKDCELPETVVAMIQARIGRLPAHIRRALRAASVFGETLWENGVKRLLEASHGEESMHNVLSDLVHEEIIDKTTDRKFANETQYRFRHALVREAAYGLISAEEATSWHAAAGAFLLDAGETDARVLAEHFIRGNQIKQAAEWYFRAAEHSFEAGDFPGTTEPALQAFECGISGEMYNKLLGIYLVTCFWRGMFHESLQYVTSAREKLRPGSVSWCRAYFGFISACFALNHEQTSSLIGEFLSVNPESDALGAYADTLGIVGSAAGSVGQRNLANLVGARIAQIEARLAEKDGARGWLLYARGYCLLQIDGKLFSACNALGQCVNLTMELGLRHTWIGFASWYADALDRVGKSEEAIRLMQEALVVQERFRQELSAAFTMTIAARILVRRGKPEDLIQADKLLEEEILRMYFQPEAVALCVAGQIAFLRGDLDRANSLFEQSWEKHSLVPIRRIDTLIDWTPVLLRLGKAEKALEISLSMDQLLRDLDIEPPGTVGLLVGLAEAYAATNAPEQARQTLERALTIVRKNVADADDPALIRQFLENVPEHVRLFERARDWNVTVDDLSRLCA